MNQCLQDKLRSGEEHTHTNGIVTIAEAIISVIHARCLLSMDKYNNII